MGRLYAVLEGSQKLEVEAWEGMCAISHIVTRAIWRDKRDTDTYARQHAAYE